MTTIPEVCAELVEEQDLTVPWLPAVIMHQSKCLLCGARTAYVPTQGMAQIDAVDHYYDDHANEDTDD